MLRQPGSHVCFLIFLSDCSFTVTISLCLLSPTLFHLPLLNYLWKICNQTAPSPQPTSSLGDTVRPLMSENSNSCSHKSLRPSELVSRCPMGNVVLFPLYIYVLFKPLRSFAWSSLIYLVRKKSISVRNAGEIRDVRELWEWEGGRRNRHRDWEREQMGNWRRRWREMKWDSQRREWKKVCGWGEEKVNTVFVTLQQGERGRESVSLYMALSI